MCLKTKWQTGNSHHFVWRNLNLLRIQWTPHFSGFLLELLISTLQCGFLYWTFSLLTSSMIFHIFIMNSNMRLPVTKSLNRAVLHKKTNNIIINFTHMENGNSLHYYYAKWKIFKKFSNSSFQHVVCCLLLGNFNFKWIVRSFPYKNYILVSIIIILIGNRIQILQIILLFEIPFHAYHNWRRIN